MALGGVFRSPAVVRVGVTVTFLRMNTPPTAPLRPLPGGMTIERVAAPTVGFYRYLYNTVGADYLWWLRRTMPDTELAELLRHPEIGRAHV